ncbi:hypothetical protein [Nesterenkonia rhizosphaerae]|uniref:Uncharacterized protein n=1 Tax=Nesterenkonia rhizosphaerae TaxID=1348272 RepID=A0ABP9G362_9MICC
MEQNRFRLRGSSLAQLGAQAVEQYGPSARIVATERISAGGVAGFFGRAYYEVTVEVSAPGTAPGSQLGAAAGERKLLPPPPKKNFEAHAERERSQPGSTAAAGPSGTGTQAQNDDRDTVSLSSPMSLSSSVEAERFVESQGRLPSERMRERGLLDDQDEDFARLMDDLWKALREPGPQQGPGAPVPLSAAGAVVVVAGLADHARLAGDQLGLQQAVTWDASRHAEDSLHEVRRSLLLARAEAVAEQVPVLALVPLKFPRGQVRSGADAPVILEADQLWAAVDARRKPEDTRAWLSVLAEHRKVDGVLPLGVEETTSPESVRQLGLPVLGAVDGGRGAQGPV